MRPLVSADLPGDGDPARPEAGGGPGGPAREAPWRGATGGRDGEGGIQVAPPNSEQAAASSAHLPGLARVQWAVPARGRRFRFHFARNGSVLAGATWLSGSWPLLPATPSCSRETTPAGALTRPAPRRAQRDRGEPQTRRPVRCPRPELPRALPRPPAPSAPPERGARGWGPAAAAAHGALPALVSRLVPAALLPLWVWTVGLSRGAALCRGRAAFSGLAPRASTQEPGAGWGLWSTWRWRWVWPCPDSPSSERRVLGSLWIPGQHQDPALGDLPDLSHGLCCCPTRRRPLWHNPWALGNRGYLETRAARNHGGQHQCPRTAACRERCSEQSWAAVPSRTNPVSGETLNASMGMRPFTPHTHPAFPLWLYPVHILSLCHLDITDSIWSMLSLGGDPKWCSGDTGAPR